MFSISPKLGIAVSKCNGKGFQITFSNGNLVSVQFGVGNYCENEDCGTFDLEKNTPTCRDAEIAAWTKDGTWYKFPHDTIMGRVTPDEVASFIQFVATSDLTKDRWEQ